MPKTLLLADDSVTIQKVVGITFANEDVELVTVDNGDDALVRARQLKPDLVLADIGMPGLNGYQLCSAIRKDPQLAHVPVLLLTGTFETYDEEQARSAGANGYIAKPFEAQALVDRVFALLAESKAKRAQAAKPPAAPAPARPAAAPQPAPVPAPAPQAAPRTQAPAPHPAAHAPAPTPSAATRPVATPAPAAAQPAPRPAAPAPQAPPAPPRRPELPPVPAPPQARPARPPQPVREVAPFEFELPSTPTPPAQTAPPAPAAADPLLDEPLAVEPIAADPFDGEAPSPAPLTVEPERAEPLAAEPLWEAEPELEPADITPIRRAEFEASEPPRAPAPDATRLFAPDLLGRATRLPDLTEPPPAASAKSSFAFEDLDFEEPTASPESQSQIFGDSSDAAHAATVLAGAPAGRAADPEDAVSGRTRVLSDPLYSQTKFLDPLANRPDGISFSTPNPALAPPLPDLLAGDDAITEPRDADTTGGDSEPLLEAEPLDAADPFVKPFSPETEAALAAPTFQAHGRSAASEAQAHAATRLMMKPEPPMAEVEPAPEPEMIEAEPVRAARRALAPRPVTPQVAASRSTSGAIDPAVLAQAVEKVAWEAFGALSEQVVNEVLKRVEAVVWEVVPQLAERLIREELARLDAEQQE